MDACITQCIHECKSDDWCCGFCAFFLKRFQCKFHHLPGNAAVDEGFDTIEVHIFLAGHGAEDVIESEAAVLAQHQLTTVAGIRHAFPAFLNYLFLYQRTCTHRHANCRLVCSRSSDYRCWRWRWRLMRRRQRRVGHRSHKLTPSWLFFLPTSLTHSFSFSAFFHPQPHWRKRRSPSLDHRPTTTSSVQQQQQAHMKIETKTPPKRKEKALHQIYCCLQLWSRILHLPKDTLETNKHPQWFYLFIIVPVQPAARERGREGWEGSPTREPAREGARWRRIGKKVKRGGARWWGTGGARQRTGGGGFTTSSLRSRISILFPSKWALT